MRKEDVAAWISQYREYQVETINFSADLFQLPDTALLNIKAVTANFLETAPAILKVITPRDHVTFRSSLQYLTQLSILQGEAWERQEQKNEIELQKIKNWIAKWDKQYTTSL